MIKTAALLMMCALATALAPTAARAEMIKTEHRGTFNGVNLSYRALAGDTVIYDNEDKPAATVFSVSYLRDRVAAAKRPVIFAFNGGPGSSSAWLHIGALGPRRIRFQQPGTAISPPYATEPNHGSPLDVADIVFIDPVGTGYSRLLPNGKPKDFFGVEPDAASIAQFIQRWLDTHGRWNSPKYVLGESYGTLRAVLVAKDLLGGVDTHHFPSAALDGLILVGQILSSSSNVFHANDLAFAELLPSLAATRWFYQPSGTLEATIDEARRYSAEVYLPALYLGTGLPAGRREEIAHRLSALTGLDAAEIARADLRITPKMFESGLLRERNLLVGAYDTRFTSAPTYNVRDNVGDDPSMLQTGAPMVAALHEYLREDLHVTRDALYEVINWVVGKAWDEGRSQDSDRVADLGALFQKTPSLRLMLASGAYDLVTPLGAAEFVASHANIPAERVVLRHYASGHMVYYGDEQVRAFQSDLRDFIERRSSKSAP